MKTNFQASGLMLAMALFAAALPFYYSRVFDDGDNRRLAEQLRTEVELLQLKLDQTEALAETISRENEELARENEKLVEENRILRAGTIIRHGSRESSKVAITMDDGNISELVEMALDYLKQEQVQATFFPMGTWVERDPGLWRRAVEEGHELGNHTHTHRLLTSLTAAEIREELALWQDTIDSAAGFPYETRYFRPPGMAGFTGSSAAYYQQIIAESGMVTVLWDIEIYSALAGHQAVTPVTIANYIVDSAQGGSIILLHFERVEIHALPHIIRGLRGKGLEPVTLTEMLLSAA